MVDGLTLVEQFLNTLDERSFRKHGKQHVPADHLTSVDELASWLEEHGFAGPAGEADLAAARALRAALRDALGGGAGEALGDFPLRLAPDPDGRLRVAADSGVPGLDAVVEAVVVSVAGGGFHRLKLCAAEDCRWAFHDTSRNGGGRWCGMATCGNRAKTRAYRRRAD